jgi:hypothetical protein
LPTVRKLFSSVLLLLEGDHLFRSMHCAQSAFTQGKSGLQLILLLQQLVEKCLEWHLPLVVAGGDVWKAYDKMKHAWFTHTLRSRGIRDCSIAAWLRLIRGTGYVCSFDHQTKSAPLKKMRRSPGRSCCPEAFCCWFRCGYGSCGTAVAERETRHLAG